MTTFILGASDPEMAMIEKLLSRAGVPFVHATHNGVRVHAGNAYSADGPSVDGPVVFVECAAAGIVPAAVIDHHNPGDHARGFAGGYIT